MNKSTKYLHEKLIRLAKGMLTAWSQWLEEQEVDERSSPGRPGDKSIKTVI